MDGNSLHPLDTNSAVPAAIKRTWLFAFIKFLIAKFTNRAMMDSDAPPEGGDGDEVSETASETAGSGTVTPDNEAAPPAILKGGRVAAVKAGGKRRKAVRKR